MDSKFRRWYTNIRTQNICYFSDMLNDYEYAYICIRICLMKNKFKLYTDITALNKYE